MAKKKQSIEDIMDRIQEDLDTLRDKVIELEDNQCQRKKKLYKTF